MPSSISNPQAQEFAPGAPSPDLQPLSPGIARDHWDLIVRPKTGWFDLHLADLWRYRDLVMLFVRRDFVAQYKQTILGPLWFIIQPLLTTLTFTLIFGNVAQLSTDGLPKILFYLSGVTAWSYFADCLMKTSETFNANANIFGKVYFPRLAVPVSIVISNLIRFGIQLGLFLGFYFYFIARGTMIQTQHTLANGAVVQAARALAPTGALWVLPFLILLMGALGLGSGIIVSSMTTRYRDLRFLVQFGVQLLMYSTPVIIPLSKLPEKYRWIMLSNPMTAVIETFRYAFLGTGEFSWANLSLSTGVAVVVLAVGVLLFNHVERTFMDTV